ncbi:MAG TPA: FtsX-like permease family protein [Candidatus Latescibacteria bacterium]|nr:FtsX-like permease family protein [Candidatus Latescibacterota bacterium]
MRKAGKYVVLAIAALMLSSVTIFDPSDITKKILIGFVSLPEGKAETVLPAVEREISDALDLINVDDTKETLERLTSWESRVVGYPGNRRAYEYIKEEFERLGLQRITTETFKVTVPIDKGANLHVPSTGEDIRLYCLWPNDVKTPTLPEEGVTGNLIYGKKGDFGDFNGRKVEGSIVLLDFDSGQNYINPRMLGAQAIIFFDNGLVTQGEAAAKFLRVPADIPRYWVDYEGAERLLEISRSGENKVRLTARMDWEEVETNNIYGYLPGLDEYMPVKGGEEPMKWKDRLIVIEAYYDAMSVVPRLAPGAENAAGITALLQVARVMKEYRPKYSLLFLATSAHFEGLTGINDFLHRHSRTSDYFLQRMPEEEKIDFDLLIGLDLSTHNDQVAAFALGTFYQPTWVTDDFIKNTFAPYAKKFSSYAEKVFAAEYQSGLTPFVNAIVPPKRTWKDYMPTPLAFDSEAVVFVGKHGITIATPDDIRERVDTPLDRFTYVNVENLTKQIRTIVGVLVKAFDDPDFFPELKLELKDEAHDLKGYIYWYNPKEGLTPNSPVEGALVTYSGSAPAWKRLGGVRRLQVTKTDERGEFRFENLRQRRGTVEVRAYKLDEDGRIIYAPDLAWIGDYPMVVDNNYWELEMIQVVFQCEALTLFDIIDPRYLTALDVLTILGPDDAVPQSRGYTLGFPEGTKQSQRERDVNPAAVVFAKPGSRVKVLMSTSLFGIKYLLTNAPQDLLEGPPTQAEVTPSVLNKALGRGYDISSGVVFNPAYKIAKDMWVVDDVRLKTLAKYAVKNERIEELHNGAKIALEEARKHLRELQYDKFIASVRKGWGLESRGYPDVKQTANDTVRGIIFYFALLLPFSFFLERLLFGFTDIIRRILGFAGIFVVVFIILQFVHPAFKLSSSAYVIFLAFVTLALSAVVLTLVVSKFNQEVRKMKQTSSGIHEVDVGRISATGAAMALGVSNLRKRPVRTGLTALTLILLTFTVLSFTSVRTSMRFYKIPRGNKPPYQGALIRDRNWKGLQNSVLEYIESAFGTKATVLPRSWYMSKTTGEKAYINFRVLPTGKTSYANGLLGMTPEEPQATGLDKLLIGNSRWFKPGDRKVCILPDDMARLVGITMDDIGSAKIRMLGSEFKVIGLIDSKKFNQFRGMDDEKLTPVDTVTEQTRLARGLQEDPNLQATAPIQAFIHLEASNVMILPHEYVMDIGGTLRSVAITSFRDEQGRPIENFIPDIEDFMSRVALTMFVGIGDEVKVYSSLGATSLSGLGNLFIPILIAALIVLNTMLGAVYERHTEIGIYSSVGLAPVHVAALFIAEASVFATIGAVMGYLIGQITAKVLLSLGMLSGISLNYSSLSAIWSTLVVMGTVFLSTLYPARKAASMAVPDVTRKWQLPEPEGDEWRFDFPFTVGGAEALGMYVYLTKVFDSYGEGSIGDFATEDVKLSFIKYDGKPGYRISLMTWLAPYDLGVSQSVTFDAIPTGKHNIYKIVVTIHRVSGDVASWKRLNRGFLHSLRKRFLVWRTVPPAVKDEYTAEGKRMLAVKTGVVLRFCKSSRSLSEI